MIPTIQTEFKNDADFIQYLKSEKQEGVPFLSKDTIEAVEEVAKMRAITTDIMERLKKYKEPHNEEDFMKIIKILYD